MSASNAHGDTRGTISTGLETYQLVSGTVANGERIRVLSNAGSVRRAQPPREARPDWTYARHPEISWIRVAPDDVVRTARAPGSTTRAWLDWARRLREAGLARADELESRDARSLYRALLFGERGGWSANAGDLFTRTGTRHVLSLSGLHVGLLSWLVAQPVGALLAWGLTALLRLAGRRRPVSSVGPQALLVWLFVPLAGGNPPVVRAAWALTLAQVARWAPSTDRRRGRRPKALHLWAFALLLECLADPTAPTRLGVQLSYAATLGLILGYAGARRLGMGALLAILPLHPTSATGRPRSPWWRIPVQRGLHLAVSSTAASFVAVVATLPITWCNFGEWSPWGLVAMPLVLPPLILFMGVASAWTFLSTGILRAWVEFAAQILLDLLHLLDRLPGTPTQLPPRPFWLLAALAASVLALLAQPATGDATRRWVLRATRATVAMIGSVWLPWSTSARTLEIVLLEVGHGTALALRAPGEGCWIFDAGSRDRPKVARDALAPLLRKWETSEVHIVVSHDDRDHTSGLPWLVERWPPTLWAGSHAAMAATPRIDLTRGSNQLPTRTAALRLDLLRGQNTHGNEGSRSLLLQWFDDSILLCGDADAAGLAGLLRDGSVPPSLRLLLMPHHGSNGRETEALLRHSKPKFVWMSRASQVPSLGALETLKIPWMSTAGGPLTYTAEESSPGASPDRNRATAKQQTMKP